MKEFRSSIAVKKGMHTLFLLFIYVLGSRLTLPFVNLNSRDFLGGSAAYLDFSVALTGGNLRSLSLFSIGLSPWMSAMILWQMFSFSKKLGLNSVSSEVQDRRKMYLTLGIALIQALALTTNLPVQAPYNPFLVFLLNTSLLVAGTFFLVWISMRQSELEAQSSFYWRVWLLHSLRRSSNRSKFIRSPLGCFSCC